MIFVIHKHYLAQPGAILHVNHFHCIGCADCTANAVGVGELAEIVVDFREKQEQTRRRERIGPVAAECLQFGKVYLADEYIGIFVSLVVNILRIIHPLRQCRTAPEAGSLHGKFAERF